MRWGVLLLALLSINFTLALLDESQTACQNAGHVWFINPNYPATWSFTSDTVGEVPAGWSTTGTAEVVANLSNHNKVLNFTGSGWNKVMSPSIGDHASDVIEFWAYVPTGSKKVSYYGMDEAGDWSFLIIADTSSGFWDIYDADIVSHETTAPLIFDTWMHVKLDWAQNDHQYLYINDSLAYSEADARDFAFDMFKVYHGDTGDYTSYIDAVGINSLGYVLGDNQLPACCGNNATSDYFSNSTHTCYWGVIDVDLLKTSCENEGHDWFSNVGSFSSTNLGSTGGIVMGAAVIDVDGDDNMDFVTASNGAVHKWVNDGLGGFTKTSLSSDWANDIVVGDINGDGYLDFITNADSTAYKFVNDGSGDFTRTSIGGLGSSILTFSIDDLDGDGDLDLIAGLYNDHLYKLINDGTGVFVSTDLGVLSGDIKDSALGDINGDGYIDIITGDAADHIYKWINDGAGGFTKSDAGDNLHPVYALDLGDIDGDGDLDVITSSLYSCAKWFNDGTGSFTRAFTSDDAWSFIRSLKIIDLDSDGDLDFITGDSDSYIVKWFNDGAGSFNAATVGSGAGSAYAIDVSDFDGDSDLDIIGGFEYQSVYKYINLGLNGTNGPCCGDDVSEDFYNSTSYCLDNSVYDDADDLEQFCTNLSYNWLTGSTTGSNSSCCGDDAIEDFYNSTLYCFNQNAYSNPDDLEEYCVNCSYSWVDGTAYGNYPYCCGDDWVWDDFYTSSTLCYDGSIATNADLSKGYCELQGYDWFSNNGTFATGVSYTTGSLPFSVALGDFDGDGNLDAVTSNTVSDSFSYFAGVGDGSFAAKVDYVTSDAPHGVAVGDFNGDGNLDVVTANGGSNQFSYFAGVGDGSFAARVSYATGSNPYGVAVGDFNGDSHLDVVTADFNSAQFSYFAGVGDGSFAARVPYTTTGDGSSSGPNYIAVDDFDFDGDLDIVVAISGAGFGDPRGFDYFENNGDGSFATRVYHSSDLSPNSLVVGDFNNDNHLDVITAEGTYNQFSYFAGVGDGSFAARTIIPASGSPSGVTAADTNGDGYLDLLATVSNSLVFVPGDGDGTFGSGIYYSAGVSGNSIIVGDLDNNGAPDVVTVDDLNQLLFFKNIGLSGIAGPCCGDDVSEDFYNSTSYCLDNTVYNNPDDLEQFCTDLSYDWFTGSTTGTGDACCGDDLTDDDFYNGTIGSTNYFCVDGSLINQGADESKAICEAYTYTWLSGATDLIGQCCGDDSLSDDFGNNTGSCCCNGELVSDGASCDLDGDGNIDSVCTNGNLPDVFISESTYNESYVTSDYSPEFLVKNTGNETICITSSTITNTTLSYTQDATNVECIEPGSSGAFRFNFGGFNCADFDSAFNPVLNLTYQKTNGDTESIIRYLNFRVTSPLDIISVLPEITASFPVPLNDAKSVLVTVKNMGTETINFNVTALASTGLFMLISTPDNQYNTYDISDEVFSLPPRNSILYRLKVVPTSTGNKTAQMIFTSTGVCANITDYVAFQVTAFEEDTSFFAVYEIPAWDWVTALMLIIIPLIILYKKFLK
ncbi:MAG: VCBS repeat-containing protein [Candidatus Nanoarchaeia archaeon]|jgi:hypothetical protein